MRRNIAVALAFGSFAIAAPARGQTVVVASFGVKGGAPLCGLTAAKPDTLDSFEETTVASADKSTGNFTGKVYSTYKLELSTLCAAPFFKAIGTNQQLSVEITYIDAQTHNQVMTISMPSASLDTVALSASADSGDAVPTLAMALSAENVTMGGPTSTSTKNVVMIASKPTDRQRAPIFFRDLSARRLQEISAGTTGWGGGKIAGTNVQLGSGSSSVNAAFSLHNFRVACRSPRDPSTGLPTGHTARALDGWQKPVDGNTAAIHNLVGHQVSPASATIVNGNGTAGVTVTFAKLSINSDNISTNSETIGAVATDGFQLTDIVSGKAVTGGC